MVLTGLQKFLHYPLGQDDPESKANDMISEFPGAFCGTLYHALSKKVLAPNTASPNLYPINCKDADYLVDLILHIQMPESSLPAKTSSFVPKIIESVELQWIDSRGTLQTLKSTTVDDNFRWRYRVVSKTIITDDADGDRAVIIVKLPWFFSKKLQGALPLYYTQGFDAAHPLQVKINYTGAFAEYSANVNVSVVAEFAHITDDERNFFMDEKLNKNPHRRKRVVYEELTLAQMKMQHHVVRMSWLSADTTIEVTNPIMKDVTLHIDPKKSPEVHWECFGNEWARDSQRFSYSVAATPDRAASNILSSTPFSNIKISNIGADEDLRFVVQKLVVFNTDVIETYV